ncbi:MAG: aa3-type cytochrome oxidase subunit IV [Actinomycetota bacterium]
MKVAYRLFLGSGVFFAVIGGMYWFTSYEPAGATMLALGLPATLLVGLYLRAQHRRFGPGPKDRPNGEVLDGEGISVLVPAASMWPPAVAAGAGIAGMGLVFGAWLFIPGAILLVISLVGQSLSGRNYS